jgi:hypothetical protein
MVESAFCGSEGVNRYFTLQAYLLTFIGPFLTILGLCICCQTRIADREKEREDERLKEEGGLGTRIHGPPKKKAKTGENDLEL